MSSSESLGGAARSQRISTLRALVPFLKPYRSRAVLAFLLLCLASGALLTVPSGFRQLIDEGFLRGAVNQENARLLDWHFLMIFGLGALWAVAVAGRYYLVNWLGERVTADLRVAVYAQILRQPPEFFETLQTGEVLSRLTGDATLVQTVVGSSISMGLRSVFQAAGGLAMLAVTELRLFAITLGLLTLLILPLMILGRRVRRLSRVSQDRIADFSALAGERLNAATTVQAYTQEALESRRYAALVETSFRSAMTRSRWRAILTLLLISAVFGAVLFVLWLGAQAVAAGSMTTGQLTSFVLYAVIVAGASATLAEVWGDVMRAAGATERLMELLHARSAIESPANPLTLPNPGQAELSFDQVEFRYPSRPSVSTLTDFSLEVRSGETLALVGPSGAGKTTLFQLLQRFYDPCGGCIRFNGVDIRNLAREELRGAIAIVPQDPVIFSANAMENIRYGRPEASDQEVLAASRSAHAHEFISELAEGYRTFLGERGVRLSGGQRQRMAIARAILKNAPLLLLDEATSALDAESERLVQQGLEAAMQNRTTLVIAHRLATVRRVDRIVVMDHGRIVEQGNAEELKQAGGLFARLSALQLID
ncbi:ABC transporter transmembrane domain-containing protein [Methyloterricola oryzae]|uniref:ABC transporter transmembrane domain-containing protein n=1 Tax=Methyloterricola oryzae TaxID=1495050 RepID=UPI0019107B8C|nr:ABC transporter transmembrane domain-containing protein [Methyloterricola oryzae]